MDGEKQYEIDIEAIKKNYRLNNGGNHKPMYKYKILPYITDESKQMTDFSGVIGDFSRIICGKELERKFDINEFIQNVEDGIGEFEGSTSREAFRNIIKIIFINDDNKLVNFNINTLNYRFSTDEDKKYAKFLYSIFYHQELNSLAKEYYNRKINNLIYSLILKALPNLKDKDTEANEYENYIPFIKDLFLEDFKFILSNEELYNNSLQRFLEYYYMFYVSQLAMKLSKFEKADLTRPDRIYYTLSWERTSESRTAYKFGWELLKNSVNKLFSHAVTLDFLNHNGFWGKYNYVQLFEAFNNTNDVNIKEQITTLINTYIQSIKNVNWSGFVPSNIESGNECFDKVYELFECIDYQFNNSDSRKGPYEKYKNKYVNFVYKSFGKMRGHLKYNLNLTEDDIILMTKICINKNEKLKLGILFDEFEKRGLFFDKFSKIKIIQLYEKLNLLEKKSDSGDAQYVRSVL